MKDILKIGWREAIKEASEQLASYPNNLQNIHTPFDLCSCIIGKLKEYNGLEGKDILVLNLEFVDVLIYDYGVVRERIWFLSECKEKTKICESSRYKGVNVMNEDFLEKKVERKFDVVAMNPPYQDATAKSSKKLWDKFIVKGIELCKESGHLAAITPFSWATPSNPVFKLFQDNNVIIVDLNGKKYFPDVGTTISWYIIAKEKNAGKTEIVSDKETLAINLEEVGFLPVYLSRTSLFVFQKIFSKPPIGVQYDYFCEQRNPIVSSERSEKFCYPVKHTASQLLWSSVPHPNTKIKKVMFPRSSAMKAEYDGKGEYGCSQHYAWIEVNNTREAEAVISYLHSDLISFVRKATQWTASWSKPILDKLPQIPLDKKMNNQEIYQYFGLNEDEIKYVEDLC